LFDVIPGRTGETNRDPGRGHFLLDQPVGLSNILPHPAFRQQIIGLGTGIGRFRNRQAAQSRFASQQRMSIVQMAKLDQVTQGLLLGGNLALPKGADIPEISGEVVKKLA